MQHSKFCTNMFMKLSVVTNVLEPRLSSSWHNYCHDHHYPDPIDLVPLHNHCHHHHYPDPIDLVPLHHQVELLVNLVVLCLRSRGQCELLRILYHIHIIFYIILYFVILSWWNYSRGQCELLIISDFHSGHVVWWSWQSSYIIMIIW